jgi:tetratricopeptide (TPR) repeat protein
MTRKWHQYRARNVRTGTARPFVQLRAVVALLPLLGGLSCNGASSSTLEVAQRKLLEGQASADSPRGTAALREAAELFRQGGSISKRAEALYWLALAEQRESHFSSALLAVQGALATYAGEEGFFSPFEAELLIGELQTALGDYAAAQAAFERARQRAIDSRSRWNEWRSWEGLAALRAKQGRPDEARAAWLAARALVVEESLWGLGELSRRWGDFEVAQGDGDAARRHYAEAVEAHRKALAKLEVSPGTANHRMHVARSRLGAAQALLASAQLEAAQKKHSAAEEACRRGLELMATLPTAAEKSADGLAWEFGPQQNRLLIEQLQTLQSEVRRKLEHERQPEPISAELAGAIRQLGDGRVALRRSLVEQFRSEPQLLTGVVRFVPETKDGKIIAVRVFGVRPNTLWGTLGFQNGDRMRTVNGVDVATLIDSEGAQVALKSATSVRVALERRDVAHQLEFSVEQ